jgi:hypothetical protein
MILLRSSLYDVDMPAHFHHDLGVNKLHFRWVPHSLHPTRKKERLADANSLLEELERAQRDDLQSVVTGDK